MSFPCPRCGDYNTQTLPMIHGTGTYVRSWRSIGGYSGTGVSQSLLSAKANPPRKRRVLLPLLFAILLASPVLARIDLAGLLPRQAHHQAVIVDGPGLNRNSLSHSHGNPRLPAGRVAQPQDFQSQPPGANSPSGLPMLAALVWPLALLARAVWAFWYNRVRFPGLLQAWQCTLLCKGCGGTFPASPNQQYLVFP